MLVKLWTIVALVMIAASGWAQTAPSPVQVMIGSTLNSANFPSIIPSAPYNKTVKMTGGDYTSCQAAFNAIQTVTSGACNEIITVDAGYNCAMLTNGTGTAGELIYKQSCPVGSWIWLRSSNYASLPAQSSDTRTCTVDGESFSCALNPSDRANMFQVTKTNTVATQDIALVICGQNTDNNCPGGAAASGLIITGMDMEWSGPQLYIPIYVGTIYDTTPPQRIFFDRVSLDSASGTFSTQAIHGIFANGSYISVTDSYIDHLWVRNDNSSLQSNNFLTYNGPGPYKLVNNFFGGTTTQKVFFGGGTPDGPNSMFDAEVRRNVMTNDSSNVGTVNNASGSNANVASLFELKCCLQRALIDGNTFLYVSNSASYYTQFAPCFNIKEDQTPATTFQTSDLTITNNDCQRFNHPAVILGQPQGATTTYPVTDRILIANNIFRATNYRLYEDPVGYGTGGSGGFAFDTNGTYVAGGPNNVNIVNNDLFGSAANYSGTTYWNQPQGCRTPGTILTNFGFTLNAVVVDGDAYTGTPQHGFMEGDCAGSGVNYMKTLIGNGAFPGSTFANNALFNFYVSSGTACAGWPIGVNPGLCLSGLASAPATINLTLGTFDYLNCVNGGALTSCAITGPPIAGVGANISLIQAAQALGNDVIINGVARTTGPSFGAPVRGLFRGFGR